MVPDVFHCHAGDAAVDIWASAHSGGPCSIHCKAGKVLEVLAHAGHGAAILEFLMDHWEQPLPTWDASE